MNRIKTTDSDNSEIEIIVDPQRKQRRVPRAQPQSHPSAQPQPRRKPRAFYPAASHVNPARHTVRTTSSLGLERYNTYSITKHTYIVYGWFRKIHLSEQLSNDSVYVRCVCPCYRALPAFPIILSITLSTLPLGSTFSPYTRTTIYNTHVYIYSHVYARVDAAPAGAVLAHHTPRRQLARRPPADILPEPVRTVIAISPCAFSHLHSSPDPPDPARKLEDTQQYAIRQGFCYGGGAAISVHGLLATSPAAEPPPVSDSGACAITTNFASATDPDDLQDASLDLDLDLDVSMDLEAGPTDAHGVENDVVPPHPPPPQLRTASTHDHPDGPMLGRVIPDHGGVDHGPGPGVDVGRALS
ncbi:hypothetical protein EDB83DRAFT_118469 [Lactarius deliciosus]|nr:hypothetical protein EDB83DRAFT_118469 [Lactarius deliciosus]